MKTQQDIDKEVKEYLAKGNKITYLPYGVRSDDDNFKDFATLNTHAATQYKVKKND